MHRTQILLDDWQYAKLKALSERKGESLSGLVREAVSRFLRAQRSPDGTRLADIAGIASDADATGREHDDVIYSPRRER